MPGSDRGRVGAGEHPDRRGGTPREDERRGPAASDDRREAVGFGPRAEEQLDLRARAEDERSELDARPGAPLLNRSVTDPLPRD